jgi:hypothetical protein
VDRRPPEEPYEGPEPEDGVGGTDDGVEEADEESFPASDPPAQWAGGS